MKKITIVFGLIMGSIFTGFMLWSVVTCVNNPRYESNDFIGYAGMLAITSLIFIAIKNYRDKYANGTISFGKAFQVGAYISLIASTLYVIVGLAATYLFFPDFLDSYTTHVLYMAELDGATKTELATKSAEMAEFKEMYKNPLFAIMSTYAEILPLGLIISLISAVLLRKKAKPELA
jgi:hypothetical protein